jgi:hypothetical protein
MSLEILSIISGEEDISLVLKYLLETVDSTILYNTLQIS